MKEKHLKKPTTYVVRFWNEDGTECIKQEMYPMHIFSLNDVMLELKGKETQCDIYESRYDKGRGLYVTNGRTIIWDDCDWVIQM